MYRITIKEDDLSVKARKAIVQYTRRVNAKVKIQSTIQIFTFGLDNALWLQGKIEAQGIFTDLGYIANY